MIHAPFTDPALKNQKTKNKDNLFYDYFCFSFFLVRPFKSLDAEIFQLFRRSKRDTAIV